MNCEVRVTNTSFNYPVFDVPRLSSGVIPSVRPFEQLAVMVEGLYDDDFTMDHLRHLYIGIFFHLNLAEEIFEQQIFPLDPESVFDYSREYIERRIGDGGLVEEEINLITEIFDMAVYIESSDYFAEAEAMLEYLNEIEVPQYRLQKLQSAINSMRSFRND